MGTTNSQTKYYNLQLASGTNETGREYPQCQTMSESYDHNGAYSHRNLRHTVFPDFTPDFNYYVLHPQAKLTDVVSVINPYFGLVVNDKVKQILTKFVLPEYRFYDVRIQSKDIFFNYNFLHIICDLTDKYNFSCTQFYISELLSDNRFFKTNSPEGLNKEIDKALPFGKVGIYKLDIKRNVNINYDIFYLTPADNELYISHRLKTALEEAKVTGIEITPTDVL